MKDCKPTDDNTQINHNIFTIKSPKDIKNNLKMGQTILGIDYGEKRIGIACSDIMLTIASPIKTIEFKNFSSFIEELKQTIKEKNVGAIVYGYPLEMSGQEGDRAKKTKIFASKVYKEIELPIFLQDERMSSSAVDQILIKQADLSRKKRKKVIDRAAAAYILQGVLDTIAFI